MAFASMSAAEQSRLYTSDPDRWADAANRWRELGEPHPLAYCQWREAEALLAGRVGRARAQQCIDEAWRTSIDLGPVWLVEQLEGLARRARITLPRDETETPHSHQAAVNLGLTPRELEILGQLAGGKSDREIADALYISKKTASVHVSNVVRKLQVANRVEAARVGQAHGLGSGFGLD
jgi:DNA-binding NarL/FixJ family response regulator